MGIEAEKMRLACRFKGEKGAEQRGTSFCLRSYPGPARAHINFEEDLRNDGGIVMNGENCGELVGVVNHKRKSVRSEGFGD
jgi:hypothetical protein